MEPNPKYLPLSWGYGLAVFLRNELFDLGILRSQEFDIPVIGVGNITVGGTGKTPCVEYLIRLLKDDCKVAVLSRGYKRQTKGYVLANDSTPATDIGDEAFQIKQKFSEVIVAVDEKRADGIKHLLQLNPKPDVVILDDCYQHRYVKPGINILLMDYNNMPDKDKLLPAGRLREPVSSRSRADIIIVTKCPADLKPIDFRVLTKEVSVYPYQRIYFSSVEYLPLRKMEPSTIPSLRETQGKLGSGQANHQPPAITPDTNVLLLTGIATPMQMYEDMKKKTSHITSLTFADHHEFLTEDIQKINNTFANMAQPKIIVTTEKDETRLMALTRLSQEVKDNLYVQPIEVRIINEQEEKFMNSIEEFVLHKKKDHSKRNENENDNDNDGSTGSPTNDDGQTSNQTKTISFADY